MKMSTYLIDLFPMFQLLQRKPTRSPQYFFDTLPPTAEIDEEESGKPSPAPTVSWMPSVWKASDSIENARPIGSKAVKAKATATGSKATGSKTTAGGAKATGPKASGGAKATGLKATGGAKVTGTKTSGGAKATGLKTTGGAKGPKTAGNVPPNKTSNSSNNGGGGGAWNEANINDNTNDNWNGHKL